MNKVIKDLQNLESWLEFYTINKNIEAFNKTLFQKRKLKQKHNLK